MSDPRRESVQDFLMLEARLLDRKDWDGWLDLYVRDAEYWVPAWDSEHESTRDPNLDVSLIYYNSRSGLEDRIFRIRTGMSSAANPLPRTCRFVGNVQSAFRPDGRADVEANWQVLSYKEGRTTQFYGTYEYQLVPGAGAWRIEKKKTLLLNDAITTALDIYSI